jgi:hypothetical protein
VLVLTNAATREVTALAIHRFATGVALADPAHGLSSPTSIFSPVSTEAQSIYGPSLFVLAPTPAVFALVFGLLAYAVIQFRERVPDAKREPPQLQEETVWKGNCRRSGSRETLSCHRGHWYRSLVQVGVPSYPINRIICGSIRTKPAFIAANVHNTAESSMPVCSSAFMSKN